MGMGGRLLVCAVLALSMTACDDAADEGDSGGDEYTFDYEDGDNFIGVWHSLLQKGAEKCMSDNTIQTVKFEIHGVPDPRPEGLINGALTGTWTCDDLVAGYPYQ